MLNFNYETANREAALYRIRMIPNGTSIEEDTIAALAMSLINDVSDYRFYSLRRVISANDFLTNYRNLLYVLKAIELHLKEINSKEEFIFNETENWFKKVNKDIKVLKDQIYENSLRLRNPSSKIKTKSVFSERESRAKYDLVDYKTGASLSIKDQASYKYDSIQCGEIFREKLEVVSVELAGSESNASYKTVKDNPNNILSPNKIYRHLVVEKSQDQDGELLKEPEGYISLILNFNGKEKLNNIYIETASQLPLTLEADAIQYWDSANKLWMIAESSSLIDQENRWQIFFDEINSDKIKVKLKQYKYIAFAEMSNQSNLLRFIKESKIDKEPLIKTDIKNIYDLSVNKIDCFYYANSSFAFYRDSEALEFKDGYSANLNVDYLVEEDDCLLERYIELESYANGELVRSDLVPLQNQESSLEKEVLVFNKRIAYLTFPVKDKDSIKIYRNGVELNSGIDYVIASGIGDRTTLDTRVGLKRDSGFGNYVAEYSAAESFSLKENSNVKYSSSEVSFDIKQGAVRPRLVFRNLNANNRSSIISRYTLLVEEKERSDSEDFLFGNDIIER